MMPQDFLKNKNNYPSEKKVDEKIPKNMQTGFGHVTNTMAISSIFSGAARFFKK
jgi:hypothetical protein